MEEVPILSFAIAIRLWMSKNQHIIRLFDYKMKIEIDYNGSLATCKVDGKLFNKCDVNEQVFAMDAFRTIIKDWERQNRYEPTRVK